MLFFLDIVKPADFRFGAFPLIKISFLLMVVLMWSRIYLLTFPISDFIGSIGLQVDLFLQLGLWSFSVIKASFSAVLSTLSPI